MISFIKNILILPFNVLITLPFILNLLNDTHLIYEYNIYFKIIGILILILGIILFTKTVFFFLNLEMEQLPRGTLQKNLLLEVPIDM